MTIVYLLISEIDGGRDYSCLKSEIDKSRSTPTKSGLAVMQIPTLSLFINIGIQSK